MKYPTKLFLIPLLLALLTGVGGCPHKTITDKHTGDIRAEMDWQHMYNLFKAVYTDHALAVKISQDPTTTPEHRAWAAQQADSIYNLTVGVASSALTNMMRAAEGYNTSLVGEVKGSYFRLYIESNPDLEAIALTAGDPAKAGIIEPATDADLRQQLQDLQRENSELKASAAFAVDQMNLLGERVTELQTEVGLRDDMRPLEPSDDNH